MEKKAINNQNKRAQISIIITVLLGCIVMGIVDAVIQPGYWIKSAIKIMLFVLVPLVQVFLYEDLSMTRYFKTDRKSLGITIAIGIAVFCVILLAYFAFKNVFDFSAVTSSLNSSVGVSKANFIWVALYISFINSFIEEFFFRGFGFLKLKEKTTRRFAYLFSSFSFAAYHVSMMIGWFGWPVMVITIAGLAVGGAIFNYVDEKWGNIYTSWVIHMFANFSINTIGLILFNNIN